MEESGAAPWRIRGSLADKLEVIVPTLLYGLMSVFGVTTSSLGLLSTRLTGSDGTIGEGLAIRSDEWLTAAPLELATLANGSSMTPPLSNGPDLIYQLSSGQPVESLVFLEGNLLRLGELLPDAMLFAAFRGYHWLLLALCLPPLLRRFGATRSLSWLGVVLCFLAPASVWWSFMPIRILGLAAAGCYVLVLARDRLAVGHRGRGLLLAALAGLFLARLVTYYVPWSLTVAVPLVLATGLHLVWDRATRRVSLATIGFGALVSVGLLVGLFWENWSALQAEFNTVYPGLRRSTGTTLPPFQLFGAPGMFELEDYPQPVGTNQSEASSAYLVCGLVAAVLWPRARAHVSGRERAVVVALASFTVLFTAWTTLDWGTFGMQVPGLSSMLPIRAAQTVGYPATLLMVLVLSYAAREPVVEGRPWWRGPGAATAAAVVAAAVTAYGVSDLGTRLPEWSAADAWLAAAVVGALVWALARWPLHWLPVASVALVSVVAHADANPVQVGLGDVRTSPAADVARAMRTALVEDDSLAVTDSMVANALLVANGVPTLSGYQVTGPVAEEWTRHIDPTGAYEGVWNRGASYLVFSFDLPEGSDPTVVEEGNDIIRVHTSPCWLADGPYPVARVVSQTRLKSPCLEPAGRFAWRGATQYVYRTTSD